MPYLTNIVKYDTLLVRKWKLNSIWFGENQNVSLGGLTPNQGGSRMWTVVQKPGSGESEKPIWVAKENPCGKFTTQQAAEGEADRRNNMKWTLELRHPDPKLHESGPAHWVLKEDPSGEFETEKLAEAEMRRRNQSIFAGQSLRTNREGPRRNRLHV